MAAEYTSTSAPTATQQEPAELGKPHGKPESLLIDALNLDRSRINHYCRTVDPEFLQRLNRKKPKTMSGLADIWYQDSYGSRNIHYNPTRYHMLNLHATFTKGTVEFRLFQFDNPGDGRKGGIHAGQLRTYIQLCLALSQMAKEVKTASPKPQQNENPKYAAHLALRLASSGTSSRPPATL